VIASCLATLLLGKEPLVPIQLEDRRTPEMVWTFGEEKNLFPLLGIKP